MKTENWGDFIIKNVPIVPYVQRYEKLNGESNNEFVGAHSTHTSKKRSVLEG